MVTVVMAERGIGLQRALDLVGEYFGDRVKEFLEWKAKTPSWGPKVDDAVSQYVFGLECVVGGNLEWSLTTPRYFGELVGEVRRTRKVALRKRAQKENTQISFTVLFPLLLAFSAACFLFFNFSK